MTCLGLFGDAWLSMRGPVAGRLWRYWERLLMTLPYDRVSFLSEFSRDAGLKMGVKPERILISSPGVNAAEFSPAGEKSGVLFVGKLHSRKGVDVVLDVARALPSVPFRLVGWGDDAGRLRASAPTNTSFYEMPPPDELSRMFDSAEIFFLPSRAETFGIAILQAMAAGCPVVSTVPLQYEGCRTAVDDRPAMIRAIERLSGDRKLCRELGARNRETACLFTWESFCGTLYETYAQFAERKIG
jgi:glycosyltransferase involved in cell wall biosynthesis